MLVPTGAGIQSRALGSPAHAGCDVPAQASTSAALARIRTRPRVLPAIPFPLVLRGRRRRYAPAWSALIAVLVRDANGLLLEVHLQQGAAMLTADAGLLEAAERHVGVEHVVGVDPDGACVNARNQALHAGQVIAPEAGAQAERAVVGQPHGVVKGVERLRHDDGTEDFFL